jgi:hypothetical protein
LLKTDKETRYEKYNMELIMNDKDKDKDKNDKDKRKKEFNKKAAGKKRKKPDDVVKENGKEVKKGATGASKMQFKLSEKRRLRRGPPGRGHDGVPRKPPTPPWKKPPNPKK